jgi:hypothetical protein
MVREVLGCVLASVLIAGVEGTGQERTALRPEFEVASIRVNNGNAPESYRWFPTGRSRKVSRRIDCCRHL